MMKFWGILTVRKVLLRTAIIVLPFLLAVSCAPVDIPNGSTMKIPTATPPIDRFEGLNEKRDPVTRVKLGRDMLVPQPLKEDLMPDVDVGPFELRGETLASALQLILDDYDISLAFESNEGLTRRITVANLHGKLKDVVNRICSLADLYCHFEDDTLTIKNTETFIVDLPPISTSASSSSSSGGSSGGGSSSGGGGGGGGSGSSGGGGSSPYTQIAAGLAAVIGTQPTVDEATRVMIYSATQRSHKYALQYFERLRKNTALVIFETNIWEVNLNNDNRTGIDWSGLFTKLGNFSINSLVPGVIPAGSGTPVSITPSYANGSGSVTAKAVLAFISARGAVKTVSQPQITVLSGSSASFAVSQAQNYVSQLTLTPPVAPATTPTTSTTTATVTTGLTMGVAGSWDQSTVYGNLSIELDDLLGLDTFATAGGNIQLPRTTRRNLQTSIRVRPGDAILIGGLVSEKDSLNDSGPGFMNPILSTSRDANKVHTELVLLLRPRVVIFDAGGDNDTPAVVDAPKDGNATKIIPAPPMNDGVKEIFKKPEPPAPLPSLSDDVKNIFGFGQPKDKSAVVQPADPAIAPKGPIESRKGGVNQ